MANSGYIKLYKKFTHWEWYDDINTKILFIHLLLTVNWKDSLWHGIVIPRGSKITSYAKLSKEVGISIQQTRRAIFNLQTTHEITLVSTHSYTIINVLKYGTYQINEKNATQLATQMTTPTQQASNTQSNTNSTTIEELKELKALKKTLLINNNCENSGIEIDEDVKKIEDALYHEENWLNEINLFDLFETEFARPITQREMEMIYDWKNKYEQKLVVLALREAIIYQKINFDYIGRILFDWERHNFTYEDIVQGKNKERKFSDE